jgi:hypothetical protein
MNRAGVAKKKFKDFLKKVCQHLKFVSIFAPALGNNGALETLK